MARISKNPDERRLEIINAAERLFNEKGFENTAVSDIVKSIGVAQGTFYYYFKSKDEVFDAIAEGFFNEYMVALESIVDDEKLSTMEKAEIILDQGFELIKKNEGVMLYLHTRENIELHERVERRFIEFATPFAVKLVKQGIEEKIFNLDYPEEVVTYLMRDSHFLGDVNILLEDRDIYFRRLKAVMFVVQKALSIDSATMEYFSERILMNFMKLLP